MSFSVSAEVPRPVEEVFDHIVEPGLLSSYFTREASGPLVPSAHVTWRWPEGGSETIDVEEVETNRRVVFRRQARTKVTIGLEALEPNRTKVTIAEEGEPEHGALWERMLRGLKARMAYGIDLRG